MQRRKETQDTYDLYGRYVEVGPGEGCLIFSHRHKGDNSLDISGKLLTTTTFYLVM